MSLAIAGTSAPEIPLQNIFDFAFDRPFCKDSSYLSPTQGIKPFPDTHPIFVDSKTERTLTFEQTRQDARRVAAGLGGLGLHFNDVVTLLETPTCARPTIAPVVLIQLPNCLPLAPVIMGTFAAGLTASMVSPALTAAELAWILQNARPRVVVTTKGCWGAIREAIGMQEDNEFFKEVKVFTVDVAADCYPAVDAKKCTAEEGTRDWMELLGDEGKLRFRGSLVQGKDWKNRTAAILWSSGTSGRSKGVLLSHNALNFSQVSLWRDADFYKGQQQKWLGYIPFYHIFGFINIFLLAINSGATVYTMSSFNPKVVLDAIPKYKITYFHMAPPVAVILSKAPIVEPYLVKNVRGENAFSTLTGGITGGAPLGHEIIAQVHKRLGFRLKLGYGLSEACSVTIQHGFTAKDMAAQAGDSGRPHFGVQIMIAKDDQDFSGPVQATKINEPGEILVKSPKLMSAYLPIGGLVPGAEIDMGPTGETLTVDGWLRTGDMGTLDAGGYLRITDRIKELIKVRAYQVPPAELEALLCSSDKIADAGVIGVYDEAEATEWPRAFVVAQKEDISEEEMKELAAEVKELVEKKTAKYKWLMGGLVFVKGIPKSPSGKILRRVMKNKEPEGVEIKLYERKKRPSKL